MYRIGICDDDKILCGELEEMLYRAAEDLSVKAEVEVWYSGESLLSDLQKGTSLELLFLDIELVQGKLRHAAVPYSAAGFFNQTHIGGQAEGSRGQESEAETKYKPLFRISERRLCIPDSYKGYCLLYE